VAVLRDGSALFGLQAPVERGRTATPVLFVVMSNGAYRTLQDTYRSMGGHGHGPCPGADLGTLDFSRAARFFGIDAVRAGSADHLRELVAGAGELTRPMPVDVPLR